MRVNSTGLGKTTLTSHIAALEPDEEGGLLMKIESTKPVHWQITCRMETSDVRAAIKMVLKPSVMLRIVKMAVGTGTGEATNEAAPTLAGKAG